MIYELRIYHCAAGRLPALNKRFEEHTLTFFETHGIEPIGFWTTVIGPSNQTLTYLLKWESLAHREKGMNALATDAEWIKVRNATEAEAVIVERIESMILAPTAYSALR
ncbi:MAG: NIPSNAP family protein [Pseudomonadota bacterium]